MDAINRLIGISSPNKQKFKLPIIKLNRGAPSLSDALWIIPVMGHMIFGLCGRTFIAFGINFGFSKPTLALFWGWLSQFSFNATFGGDAFSIPGNIAKVEYGSNRVPKVLFQLVAPFVLYFFMLTFLGQRWIDERALPSLSTVKVCGYPSGESAQCRVSYCGYREAMLGQCSTGRAQGCCLTPLDVVIDEVRHNFLLNYTMKMITPYLGLWVPFMAATLQALVRLMPSSQLGLISNPNPHILRAALSGDYSTIHLVFGSVVLAQFLALYASDWTWKLVKVVSRAVIASPSEPDLKPPKTPGPLMSGKGGSPTDGRDESALRKKAE
mmetsp:Transcript_15392/g.36527  ORF Transcript_15392/g.36527 Transcript_15392/m.36527 type:complete len:325 (+) Transcript_15392:72-1046(+)